MHIKVCGIKYQDNLDKLSGLAIDMIGLNFYRPSKRFVADQLDFSKCPNEIKKVGVFVNEPLDSLFETVDKHQLDFAQLHGDEDPIFCKTVSEKIKTIKVFRIGEDFNFKQLESFYFCPYFLFDTYAPQFGGSGKSFDWTKLKAYTLDVPFYLSGGIGPEDIDKIKQISHPQFAGIDINSRFEKSPALKNVELVNNFITKLKST